jgi:hypothetical protein
MNVRGVFNRSWLAVGSAAVAVALTAGGIAYASAPPASAPARSSGITSALASVTKATGSAAGTATPGRSGDRRRLGHLIWLVHHAVHAELILRTRDGYRAVEIDRGTLQSDASGTITIVRPDGPTVKAELTTKTRFPGLTLSELKPGDRVVLVQSSGKALAVRARSSDGGP